MRLGGGGGVNASRLVLSAMKYRAFEAITISLAVELYTVVIRGWLQGPIQLTSRSRSRQGHVVHAL